MAHRNAQRITRSFLLSSVLPPSVSPAPYPLVPPVRPRVTDPVAAIVVAVHRFAAGTCTSGRSPVHPSALLRCLAVRQPSTQGPRGSYNPESDVCSEQSSDAYVRSYGTSKTVVGTRFRALTRESIGEESKAAGCSCCCNFSGSCRNFVYYY